MKTYYIENSAISEFASLLKEKSNIDSDFFIFPDDFINAYNIIIDKMTDLWIEGKDTGFIPIIDCLECEDYMSKFQMALHSFDNVGLINCPESLTIYTYGFSYLKNLYLFDDYVVHVNSDYYSSYSFEFVCVPVNLIYDYGEQANFFRYNIKPI